jgi:dihydrofolate reductase
MKAIVAVSSDWGIGLNGRLLFHLPGDMIYFREKTWGLTMVMGRTTLESLPGKKPLKGRDSIVLSSDTGLKVDGARIVRNIDELFAVLKHCMNEVFVIGGESVFRLLLPYCEAALVTKVDAGPEADRFFPNLDGMPEWIIAEQSEDITENGLTYRFFTYLNQAVSQYKSD